MKIQFPSLMPVSPGEEAEIRARGADTLIRALQAGLLTQAEARSRLLELL
jgi:hypothetical protein